MTTIGVLALQGDFAEHAAVLTRSGVDVRGVRLPKDLAGISGLILPGGESTTFANLLEAYGLRDPIRSLAQGGMAIWGTCAGLIALANRVRGRAEAIIGGLDVEVERNAYGRQVDSFETDIHVPALGEGTYHAVFIRAPVIIKVGPGVKSLAALGDGPAIAVRQGNLLGTSFHPELTEDARFHQYFVQLAEESSRRARASIR
ncbi:MAG: pyridoxal 5'-phosphate synthase glutaminase subunit PdxT [Chloroflexi bacterium]|nr:pyridoxal 5'-phosphate synthase glutaminase subunit PdxT [Chloroflexota bacterium]